MSTVDSQKTTLEIRIRQKAQAAYDAALKKAADDAGHLIEKTRDAREADLERAVSGAEEQAEAYARENKANAELEAKLFLLKAKDAFINKVFALMWEKFGAVVQADDYAAVARGLIEEGAAQIKADTLKIAAGRAEKKVLTEAVIIDLQETLKKDLKRDVRLVPGGETIPEPGGVILSNEAGTLEYDNSWQSRFDRLKEELYLKVSDIIFK
jgi:vacuolar-type H+-ATPase subunit E/Vma4